MRTALTIIGAVALSGAFSSSVVVVTALLHHRMIKRRELRWVQPAQALTHAIRASTDNPDDPTDVSYLRGMALTCSAARAEVRSPVCVVCKRVARRGALPRDVWRRLRSSYHELMHALVPHLDDNETSTP